ncbi:hypothetical protein TUM19329_25340 [Legionella antarctica]|uniref:Coiled coil domain-containing protein n=1 Tax=Legionella antarctica TaxID=2708020 RepID=A0A6F8T7I9_9GAMM|nr:hypothetical protein [Legionella antarctica]BCA96173.1 hypothetical protein TUM19329_25340 [Legionella antarctica]
MAFYNGLPLFGPHLLSNSRLAIHSPEEQKKLQIEYRNALGIGKSTTFSAEAFDDLAKGSPRDVHLFKETKGPGDAPLHQKLTGAAFKDDEQNKKDAASKVREAINTALTVDQKFTDAQKDYNESVATFRQLADQVPGKFKVNALINLMVELKSNAIKAIKVQQQAEKKALEDKFQDPDFRVNLSQTLNLNSDSDIDVVKTNMIADLETNQKKQLDSFEKSTTESVNTLHKAAAAEQSELLFIANLYKNNAEMRRIIIDKVEHKRQQAIKDAQDKGLPPPQQPPAVGVTIGASQNGMVLSGITMADLPLIKTLSGKYDIHAITGKPGSFSMDMGSEQTLGATLFNPAYYQDPRQNVKADFMLMVQAVRASGFDKIKMEMDFQPQEVALERARQAYEAAIESGFSPQAVPKDDKNKPDKIVIMVNGKEMRVDELFADQKVRLDTINGKAASIAEELKKLSDRPKSHVDLVSIRQEMNDLRAKNRTAKEQEVTDTQTSDLDGSTTLSA